MLDDGVTRVFINTEGDRHRISKELANLIDYISTGEVTDDYTRQLDDEVNVLRNDPGRELCYMTYMQTILENREMAYEEGTAYGRAQTTKDFVLSMLQDNEPLEKIAKYTRLTLEQVRELAASLHQRH